MTVAVGACCSCQAEDQADGTRSRNPLVESGNESEHLFGDLEGWRSRLIEHGWHFQMHYIGESLSNFGGGVSRGSTYAGIAETAVDIDLQKATRFWNGGRAFISSLWLHGGSLSQRHVGDVMGVSNIDAYDSVRLYEWWLDQTIYDGTLSLRMGQQLADEEFATTEYGAVFLASAFGWPQFVSANTLNTGPAFNAPALGVRLRWQPDARFYVQSGIFDGDTFDDPFNGAPQKNANGTRIHLSDSQGLFFLSEAGVSGELAGLQGAFKLGVWWHSGHDGNGRTPVHGVYFSAEQLLWEQEPGSDRGLGAFARIGGSPSWQSAFNLSLDAGLSHKGLLPSRQDDSTGVGIAWTRASDSARQAARSAGTSPLPDYELTVEADYLLQLGKGWSIQPHVQWIIHPGASSALSDAVVAGLRTTLTF